MERLLSNVGGAKRDVLMAAENSGIMLQGLAFVPARLQQVFCLHVGKPGGIPSTSQARGEDETLLGMNLGCSCGSYSLRPPSKMLETRGVPDFRFLKDIFPGMRAPVFSQ